MKKETMFRNIYNKSSPFFEEIIRVVASEVLTFSYLGRLQLHPFLDQFKPSNCKCHVARNWQKERGLLGNPSTPCAK